MHNVLCTWKSHNFTLCCICTCISVTCILLFFLFNVIPDIVFVQCQVTKVIKILSHEMSDNSIIVKVRIHSHITQTHLSFVWCSLQQPFCCHVDFNVTYSSNLTDAKHLNKIIYEVIITVAVAACVKLWMDPENIPEFLRSWL